MATRWPLLPGPGPSRYRVYESPGGQLWSVVPSGLQEFRDGQWVSYEVAEIAEHFQTGRTNEIPLLPVRQGRVLILLPDRLLLFEAEDPERPRVELLRRADQSSLGSLTALIPTRDGALWLSGTAGFEMHPGPARNLKPDETWVTANSPPPEVRAGNAGRFRRMSSPFAKSTMWRSSPNGAVWVATSDGLFRRAPMIWETTIVTHLFGAESGANVSLPGRSPG